MPTRTYPNLGTRVHRYQRPHWHPEPPRYEKRRFTSQTSTHTPSRPRCRITHQAPVLIGPPRTLNAEVSAGEG